MTIIDDDIHICSFKQNPTFCEENMCFTFDDFIKYNSSHIDLQLTNKSNIFVGTKFLQDCLNNPVLFKKIKNVFSNPNEQINYFFLSSDNKKIILQTSLCKVDFLNAVKKAQDENVLKLNDIENDNLIELQKLASFNQFKDKYKNKQYTINIDGSPFVIDMAQVFNIFSLDDKIFETYLRYSLNYNDFHTKQCLMYGAISFFDKVKLFDNYIVPENFEKKYKIIKDCLFLDIEALNKLNKTEDENIEKISVNEQLKTAILKDMPNTLTKLQKSIYIYIKMCKLLSYDEEFYVLNQVGEIAKKHEDLKNISQINAVNNKVVCYEFNLIYGKLLNELGINFKTHSTGKISYGGGHSYLQYRSGNFLVSADSVISILNGDLYNAKLNFELNGIKCLNKNAGTNLKFNETIEKIYNLIKSQENNNEINENSFNKNLIEYKKIANNIKPIELTEKLNILFEKVNEKHLEKVDSLAYMLELKRILFNEHELKNKVSFCIIKDIKSAKVQNKLAVATVVIAVNKKSLVLNSKNNEYFIYSSNNKLEKINKEDLSNKFISGEYGYINEQSPKIPGIHKEKNNEDYFFGEYELC